MARGRPYRNPSHIQSVVATHLELHSIELAPGEPAYEPPPSELPAPPLVRTLSELEARRGRGLWVHCAGVLASLRTAGEDEAPWLAGTFRLEDGAELPLRNIPRRQPFAELEGRSSTILARIIGGSGSAIELAPARICPGVVERCQMTLDNTRD